MQSKPFATGDNPRRLKPETALKHAPTNFPFHAHAQHRLPVRRGPPAARPRPHHRSLRTTTGAITPPVAADVSRRISSSPMDARTGLIVILKTESARTDVHDYLIAVAADVSRRKLPSPTNAGIALVILLKTWLARTNVRGYEELFHLARWQDALLDSRFAPGVVVFPKPRPVISVERRQSRIAGNHRAQIRPVRRFHHESTFEWIEQDVISAG